MTPLKVSWECTFWRSVPYQWMLLLLVRCIVNFSLHKRKGFHRRTTSGKTKKSIFENFTSFGSLSSGLFFSSISASKVHFHYRFQLSIQHHLHTLKKPWTHCLKITQNVAFELLAFWHFSPIFVLLKLTCLVTLFDSKLQVLKNSPKWSIFGIFGIFN